MPRGNTGLGELIHAFEITNRTLNRSPKTTAWHSNNLRLFKDFLVAQGSSLAISDVGIQEAREYILYLQERKKYMGHPLTPTRDERLSPRTVRAHVESLKAFFSWLFAEGYTESNTLKRLRFPAVPMRYVEVLNAEEIGRILASIDHTTTMGLRNMAIMVTLCGQLTFA
jgi:site-specific recombinase XerD